MKDSNKEGYNETRKKRGAKKGKGEKSIERESTK